MAHFASNSTVLVPALAHGDHQRGCRGHRIEMTGAIGLALGALFLLYRKNIWPLMLAHALVDSLVFTAHYRQWDI